MSALSQAREEQAENDWLFQPSPMSADAQPPGPRQLPRLTPRHPRPTQIEPRSVWLAGASKARKSLNWIRLPPGKKWIRKAQKKKSHKPLWFKAF